MTEYAPVWLGPARVVERRVVPRLLGRHRHRASRTFLSDEDVRAIRFLARRWAKLKRSTLATRFGVSTEVIGDVLRGNSYGHVIGLPLSQRLWRSPREQRMGLVLWLAWLLWILRVEWRGCLRPADPAIRVAVSVGA